MNDYTQTPNSDIYNYNVIYDDEDVIGKVLDIKKCFMYELIREIKSNETDVDEKISQISLIQDLLLKLKKENNSTVIKVSYNPMGAFNFGYLNWEVKE